MTPTKTANGLSDAAAKMLRASVPEEITIPRALIVIELTEAGCVRWTEPTILTYRRSGRTAEVPSRCVWTPFGLDVLDELIKQRRVPPWPDNGRPKLGE